MPTNGPKSEKMNMNGLGTFASLSLAVILSFLQCHESCKANKA